jgi:hypothetical protein
MEILVGRAQHFAWSGFDKHDCVYAWLALGLMPKAMLPEVSITTSIS